MTLDEVVSDRDGFAERVFASSLGYFDILSIHLGLRLGLYRALADGRAMTSDELASAAGIDERYAREWLEQQATRAISSPIAVPNRPGSRFRPGTPRSSSTATRCRSWARASAN